VRFGAARFVFLQAETVRNGLAWRLTRSVLLMLLVALAAGLTSVSLTSGLRSFWLLWNNINARERSGDAKGGLNSLFSQNCLVYCVRKTPGVQCEFAELPALMAVWCGIEAGIFPVRRR
jgi:hypothetical protein